MINSSSVFKEFFDKRLPFGLVRCEGSAVFIDMAIPATRFDPGEIVGVGSITKRRIVVGLKTASTSAPALPADLFPLGPRIVIPAVFLTEA